MKYVIITGMSGAGKSTALKYMEDNGYFCVDNFPIPLIEKFVQFADVEGQHYQQIALGLDIRNGQALQELDEIVERLRSEGTNIQILFMDASDSVLLRRYKETRRTHPLAGKDRIEVGITRERAAVSFLKEKADYIIDTSQLLTRELKSAISNIFVTEKEYDNLFVTIMSFGFKHGIPADADLVFDVRFLPNPFYIDELKYMTGNDKGVQDYVMSFPETGIFLDKLTDMIQFLIPNYITEGKNQLVISIGCTGGKHRSVTLANELYKRLSGKKGYGLKIEHRDIGKDALRGK